MIDLRGFNSLIGLINTFSTEQKCIEYLEQIRWNGKVVSPFDPTSKVYKCSKGYWCKNTNKVFNVKTGTLFENTKIPLQKWFISIWLITSHKKGISSLQLSKDINVTQKTGWFMLQRIRKCFEEENNSTLYNEVEVDETYIGGRERNKNPFSQHKGTQGRSTKSKTPVIGMVERKGKLVSHIYCSGFALRHSGIPASSGFALHFESASDLSIRQATDFYQSLFCVFIRV